MEISIVSKEVVKPSSPSVHLLKPFKISLLDQLTPTTFAPLILFYPMKNTHLKSTQISTQLKQSLSKTLDHYYPLAGREKDNLIINDYDKGVPFIETQVSTHLFDFLQNPKMESLNKFLPDPPFCYQLPNPKVPQVAMQLNTFDCGGIALGLCFSHKINDGATTSAFLRSWAAMSRGAYAKVVKYKINNLSEASLLFPPQNPSPKNQLSTMEKIWFRKGNYKTKRFVFDAKSIATLRAKSKGERVHNPTRIEALSAFILKSSMLASSSSRFVLHQAVNIRRLTEPRLSVYSVGNLFLWATAAYDSYLEEPEMGMHELVAQMRQAAARINSDYIKTLNGDEGFPRICEYVKHIEDTFAHKNLEAFTFSSWLKFGFNEVDFGWGNPIWSAIFGEIGSDSLRNIIFFKGIGKNDNAVEAWVTLDEKIMSILENDPEFLAMASPNPSIITCDISRY